MTTRVAIIGAGGHARDTLEVFEACNRERPGSWEIVGFLSELEEDWERTIDDLPVLGGLEWLEEHSDVAVVCGIGSPAVRRRIAERCGRIGVRSATVVHPDATVPPRIELGDGVVVTAGVVLTNRVRIGDHVHLNINATVAHDAVIGDYTTIAPGANISGNVTLGAGCDVGTGAAIVQKVTVGEWTIVGAGAVVIADLPADVTAVGVPARIIRHRPAGWWHAH